MKVKLKTFSRRSSAALLLFGLLAATFAPPPTGAAARTNSQDKEKSNAHVPDRRGRVAFASDIEGNFEIYVADPDGGGIERITNNPAEDFNPTWSPDGKRLAFTSDRDGNQEIYATPPGASSPLGDGTAPVRLTESAARDYHPAWSPDGAKIAFTSERDGQPDIYLMNADGSNLMRLTTSTADDYKPAWSPDGSKIAFTSERDGNDEIYVMNADGSAQMNVSQNPADDLNPAWSAMRITFQSTRDGDDEIYVMNANGGNQRRLTENPAFDGRPSRSSDGSKIVFVREVNEQFELFSMNADGSNPVRLTDTGANEIDPDVQPLSTTSPRSTLQFSASNFSVNEGAGSITVNVTRTGDGRGAAAVDFSTVSGTASHRSDFIPAFGTLRFLDGETAKTFTVLIVDDGFAEPDEDFFVTLSGATGAQLGAPSTTTVKILDNETSTSAANPIDDPQFFVRQQYLDFLNREPDAAGLAFWTSQITQCGSDARCISDKRADVSAAFFLSIEFQETGFFALRTYRALFDRFPRFFEFLPDAQRLQKGVQVGAPGAEERLAANKREYVEQFVVNRESFRERFDGKTNEQYVDALNLNTGGSLSVAERNALVAGLNNGTETRATVLLKVVENSAFRRREFNRAFVLMQYFGYLRRNPDDPPDNDFAGFNFWLAKLNQFGGDFRRAEMVKAFILSTEYRRRFGQP